MPYIREVIAEEYQEQPPQDPRLIVVKDALEKANIQFMLLSSLYTDDEFQDAYTAVKDALAMLT